MLDVIVQARDHGLFHAITDCGAGGFSSAVGEMGAELGADGRARSRAAQVPGAFLYRDLDLRGPGADGPGRPAREMAGAPGAVPERGRRGDRPGPSSSTRAGSRSAITASMVADLSMNFLHEGRPAVVREATWTPPAERPLELARPSRFHGRPARALAALGRLQQGMDRPPVRPRGPGADGDQAAGGRRRRRPRRRGGDPAGARVDPRPGRRLRHQPALRPDRPLRDGRLRHRRGDSQLRGRRRRSRADRASRQFLLGQHRAARDARLAGAGRAGLPRRGPGLRHAVHLGQGQPEQRIHARRPEPGDSARRS